MTSTTHTTERTVGRTTVNAAAASVANNGGMDMRLHQPELDEEVAEDVRLVERNGRQYLVFPIIVSREMVLEYPEEDPPTREYLSKERLQESVELWSGTPLTFVHPNNPQRTAADPFAYTSYNIGEGHEPEIVGENNDKLCVYGWLDIAKAEAIGDLAADVVEKLKAGEELSVSAGYVTLNDRFVDGEFNGEPYDVEQGIVIPDHIAIFPSSEFLARCTPEDGCAAPRVNTVLDHASDDTTYEQMKENNEDGDVTERLSLRDDVAPYLSTVWDISTGEAQRMVDALDPEGGSDRDILAQLVATEYDGLDLTDVKTVLSRAEEGDITVNTNTLRRLLGASPTVTAKDFRQNASCGCSEKANAEAATQTADGTDTPVGPSVDESAESAEVADTDSSGADTTDGDTSGSESETESDTDATESVVDEPSTETDTESTSSDTEQTDNSAADSQSSTTESTDNETDTQPMPEHLSVEEIASNSAYGLDELQEWDEDELRALEMTILTNNPDLADEAGEDEDADGGEMTENKDSDYDDKDNKDEYDGKENSSDAIESLRKELEETKAMVEDAVNTNANAQKKQKARSVANAIEGMSEDTALKLDDDELDTLAEKHNAQPVVTTNYGAVAGPMDRNPQQGQTEEDLSDIPAGGRSEWEARKNGGD